MEILFYAQPYQAEEGGFYFRTAEEYHAVSRVLRDSSGAFIEELEIQVLEGSTLDCAVLEAVGVTPTNLGRLLHALETWSDEDKLRVIIAVGECGYRFEAHTEPDDFDIDIYELDDLRALAQQFVEEGLFGDIADQLYPYLDYDAIARDLGMDYVETEIAGQRLIYRCG